ncbi:MAG: MFS transporter [Nitrospinota bacterium]|nr:MFS transporter [Nitrospinota bacterium]
MTDRPNRLSVLSWSLYDFANTIFSMNVISLYFALWVTVDHGGQDIFYSFALSGSMLAVALSIPVFGAVSDHTGGRRRPLALLTLICIICTAGIGLADQLAYGLTLFILANYCYQSAMVFYNGMLPEVSRGTHVGLVSGLGVALGYLGSIAGLLIVKPFVSKGGLSAAFLPTAILFLVFAIPCFLFVKDPPKKQEIPISLREAFRKVKETAAAASRYKDLFKFIGVHFLVLDVVNTIIAFMAVYANKVIGFDDSQINKFLIVSTLSALVGSLALGWGVKIKGTLWSYGVVLGLWGAALLTAVCSQSKAMFWLVGPMAGAGMGGVWVVSRALLIQLSPPEKVGEFFGFYGLAGKIASILGPLLWGSIVWVFEGTGTFKYRAAVSALFLVTLAAAGLFRSLVQQLSKAALSR